MHKFFVPPQNIFDDKVVIEDKEDFNHFKVLHIKKGESIIVSDGMGNDYEAEVYKIDKDKVTAKIVNILPPVESNIDVTLYQALPKSTKMDLIVQKCTELGINSIVPVITERVVVKWDDNSSKLNRWRRIAYESSKQCRRSRIPQVHEPMSFEELLNLIPTYDIFILPYETENVVHLKDIMRADNNFKKIGIFIGPEGGFSNCEIIKATEKGARVVTLGSRILRTETAGFVTVSIIMYEMGDIG
ncbi:16S rRNA (uracil1498-N3)-methyltransferase [Caldanaerobius fijiensis DSM 17918]|uniref:Ribosomal RNA small subunit methyltransferase E n=1 Tax=Caldanaerobius fijiensis DSM 17918 TaxID=1121256 RepID=A0A1M4SEK2_9THEO|nr:RsmE family RNA methyltransferase [Caldanaerobius fijiensis]SHE30673.1 16S rRNA (uracil1498-N3)-methyltransferase [Caldanaerobius fijiensis DSM 17918]